MVRHLRLYLAVLLLLVWSPLWAGTIRVHYDTGWGHSIAIRGSKSPFSWTAGQKATWTTGNVWVYSFPTTTGAFEFKPLVDDSRWSTGGNFKVPSGGATVDVYPFFGPSAGTLKKVASLYSPQLGNYRGLILYLPPSYNENKLKRYPVLYMHDGQNLFEASTSFGGVEWQVDETMNSQIAQGLVREAIVVGINNTSARIDEYTPMPDPEYGGGKGDRYLDFVEQTVKPYVDANYRTLAGKQDTLMMGSSLGGLISCWAGYHRSQVFGGVGCMSSSFWWDDEEFTREVESDPGPKRAVRVYVDAGGQSDGATETARFRDALAADGWTYNVDLWHWYEPSGSHSEASWAARLFRPLQDLLPYGGEVTVSSTASTTSVATAR